MVSTSGLVFKGHEHFRQRLLLATLSGKSIRIDDIRSDNEEHPGLMGTDLIMIILIFFELNC
jgi:RNA 3'-terminal phosphate cyclase